GGSDKKLHQETFHLEERKTGNGGRSAGPDRDGRHPVLHGQDLPGTEPPERYPAADRIGCGCLPDGDHHYLAQHLFRYPALPESEDRRALLLDISAFFKKSGYLQLQGLTLFKN